MAQILQFRKPYLPTFERVAENLWLMRMDDTPESQAQTDKLMAELRASDYEIPSYMREDDT